MRPTSHLLLSPLQAALEYVRQLYGVHHSRCVAAGDSGNDTLMLGGRNLAIGACFPTAAADCSFWLPLRSCGAAACAQKFVVCTVSNLPSHLYSLQHPPDPLPPPLSPNRRSGGQRAA